ncbi:MAG: Hsp20/alpha crystallin family protein [Gammaproteobacteria bacterium]|nr:Hsp20/alpha crystallin family protein [Gammaproteobacteria bacterium]NNF60974.1 Hsp20/alpha crystallin family protein [Gammaproteobacteria bacterium]NNM21262.1 Hsp20/alpha crystallin family protein [Gammaproteobacteria bacterium]
MNLMRYEPWDTARSLHREIDRLFRDIGSRDRETVADWVPAVDLQEQEDCFLLHVDVPGVDPQNIDIAVEGGVLTLSGQRESTSSDDHKGFRRVERISGRFLRRFTLPDGVDTEAVSARSENGVLEISIPKAARTQRKRIEIRAS